MKSQLNPCTNNPSFICIPSGCSRSLEIIRIKMRAPDSIKHGGQINQRSTCRGEGRLNYKSNNNNWLLLLQTVSKGWMCECWGVLPTGPTDRQLRAAWRRRRRRTGENRSWRPFPFNKRGARVEFSICHVMMATLGASCYSALLGGSFTPLSRSLPPSCLLSSR